MLTFCNFNSDELKGLDFKKQLVSIKKKWSAKADTTYRLLVLGATEKFVSFYLFWWDLLRVICCELVFIARLSFVNSEYNRKTIHLAM